MKRTLTVLLGLLGMFLGVELILPALAKARDFGAMPTAVIGPYTVGVMLTLLGISIAVVGLCSRKKKPV